MLRDMDGVLGSSIAGRRSRRTGGGTAAATPDAAASAAADQAMRELLVRSCTCSLRSWYGVPTISSIFDMYTLKHLVSFVCPSLLKARDRKASDITAQLDGVRRQRISLPSPLASPARQPPSAPARKPPSSKRWQLIPLLRSQAQQRIPL